MKLSYFLVATFAVASFSSCVSNKKFKAEQARYADLNTQYSKLQGDLKGCEDEKVAANNKIHNLETELKNLNSQMDLVKQTNTTTLKQLEDLSVISAQQADNIKKSLENIGAKDMYIQDLQSSIARKDSLNLALVMNLKGALGNLEDQDVNIKVDKGVVFIDISDKLLFKSGSYDVTEKAKVVLGKVATVLKAQPDMEYMVEGHTDNQAYKGTGVLKDNWDLSVMRATTIVRLLQKQYGLNPASIAAAGRGEFKPVADNSTAEGRAANRRTRIVILPQLDQFFQLLETKK